MPTQIEVDDPIKSVGMNNARTQEAIKAILKDGTPKWFSHPEDYKNMAREAYLADKESNDALVAEYRMENQEVLTDAAASIINIIDSREFLKKLRDNGVRCWTYYNGMPQTVGLWALKPHAAQPTYITYMQTPAMCEWDVLRLDAHGLPNGLDYRGWRSVLFRLIEEGVLTEEKAHEIFGAPSGARSQIYRKDLWQLRNGKRKKPNPTA